jgi:uncharacterized membrane protein
MAGKKAEYELSDNWFTTERIIGFSDSLFAFAITLLALNIDLPESLPAGQLIASLMGLGPHIFHYAISFFVVGSFWIQHHNIFRHIRKYDRTLMWLNLLFLMLITFAPFLTDMMSDYAGYPVPVIIYSIYLGTCSLMLLILWLHASHEKRLLHPQMPENTISSIRFRAIAVVIIFFLSAVLAFYDPFLAQLSWLSTFALFFLTQLLFKKQKNGH